MSFNYEGEQPVDPSVAEEQIPAAKGSKKWIAASAAAAVVVVLTVGGVAAVKVLGGGGSQPEDVLPGNAIAFAKLDLNPSAGQKLAAYQLISKFPKAKSKVTSQDTSLKESIFGSIFTSDSGMGLTYKTDVAPWLGDRVGVGAFPDIDGDKKPQVALAIAVTDEKAAKTALDKAVVKVKAAAAKAAKDAKAAKAAMEASPGAPLGAGEVPLGADKGSGSLFGKDEVTVGYAFADGYVIISDTDAHAAALVKAGKAGPLAGTGYAEDVKKLGSDQIGVAWVDIAAAYKAVPKDLMSKNIPPSLKGLIPVGGDSKASGRIVEGLHADADFVELITKSIDVKGADGKASVDPATVAGPGLIESFPSEVLGAFTASGLGKTVGALYTTFTAKDDSLGIKSTLSEVGINSAKDIESLLGAETGVMAAGKGGVPQFAVRTRGGDPDAALATVTKALTLAGPGAEGQIQSRKVSDPAGIVVGTPSADPSEDLMKSIASTSGSKLGSSAVFRKVIPQTEKATFVAYVDLSKVIALLPKEASADVDLASLKPLSALGMTATGGADPTVRIRLSFK